MVSEILDCPNNVDPDESDALALLTDVLEAEETLAKAALAEMNPQGLNQWIDRVSFRRMVDSMESVRDQTRLVSLGLEYAGDWLHVVSCIALGLLLKTPEFKVAVLYILGLPIHELEGPCVGMRPVLQTCIYLCGAPGPSTCV